MLSKLFPGAFWRKRGKSLEVSRLLQMVGEDHWSHDGSAAVVGGEAEGREGCSPTLHCPCRLAGSSRRPWSATQLCWENRMCTSACLGSHSPRRFLWECAPPGLISWLSLKRKEQNLRAGFGRDTTVRIYQRKRGYWILEKLLTYCLVFGFFVCLFLFFNNCLGSILFIWRHSLTMQPRLTLNSESSYSGLFSIGIAGNDQQPWFILSFY